MDAGMQTEATLRESLPWVKMTLDQMEQVAELIPEDELDWRPEDPSGKYCFSLSEIVKHVTDARVMFASQLSGEEKEDAYWSEPDEDGTWKFAAHKDKAELLDRLAASRHVVEPWLDKPVSALLEVTDGTRAIFDRHVAALKEQDKPVEDWERRGSANINRVLMALAIHEAGHRGTLQTLLRQKGINIGEDG